ncbi:MAG: M6 family metalloprotease domain-containing protein, partial [Fibromonadaceae bacterium]|nr:M6 family metalloprotease domain-containing protein [Fibromonadaceae bacterium]
MKAIKILIIAMAGLLSSVYAVPASPSPGEHTLPDGSTITVQLFGDENVSWRETNDEYTILFNGEGFLEYAVQDESGDLKLSGVRVRHVHERTDEEKKFLEGHRKKLRYSRSQVEAMRELRRATNNAIESVILQESGSQALSFDFNIDTQQSTISGEVRVPIFLVQFQGKSLVKTKADFEMLFNQLNYTAGGTITGSLRDYFKANSYGKLDLQVDIYGPYTLPNPISAYDSKSGGSNSGTFGSEVFSLAQSAGFNFSKYPNPNMPGYAVSPHFIFAGYGQENAGVNPGQSIWSHAGTYSTPINLNGISVRGYSCSPELSGSSGTNITYIGVIAHELGHSLLGLPDFYDTDYEGSGGQSVHIDQWDLMASGSWGDNGRTPTNLSAYARAAVGWASEITLSNSTNITIPNPATQGVVYRINTSTPNEYFLLENRQKINWDAYIPNSGLLIYHVDKNHSGWASSGVNYNKINANPSNRGYYVKQAGCAIVNG